MQTELEIIYKKSYRDICSKLDQNKIHFFGCSHTEGTGHESPSTTYPSVLSTLLNLEYVNHALGGKGNYDIEDLMNTFTIQNSKIVVQFTDMYRIRYFYDNILFQSALHRADPCVHNPIFLSEENLFFNFKKIVERIVNRLREGNNQFLITFSHNIESDYSIKSLEFLLEFKEFRSMQDCAIDVGTDNVHFGIITHKLWANRLYKRWVELYGQT